MVIFVAMIFSVRFIFFLSLIYCGTLLSQSSNIRGFVYTKDDGEPALFCNVFLKGTTYGANTDLNGFFSISKVPAGTYTLAVTYIGYDTLSETITITKAGEIINKKYFLVKGAVQLQEIVLTAEQQEKQEETKVAVQKIDPIAINKLASVGEPDIAQYMQVMPGVIFTGDQGGQLYIRGGTPVQNKVLLDGMIVYNPFHSIGLFSVFDNDIIRNADVYSGGFGAEYGGRISSVMDVSTRDGNKKRLVGKIAASTFGAKAQLEGPLVKLREDGKGSISFLLSGKTSYLPQSSKIFYNYIDTAGLPFGFNDYYGKISFNATNGSKLNLFGFNFSDFVNYPDLASFKWNSYGAGSNFVAIPSNATTLIEGNFAFSKYLISAKQSTDSIPRTSNVQGFNVGFKFTNFIGKNEIQYGFEFIGLNTDFRFRNDFGKNISQQENTTELAGYIKYKFVSKNKKLIFEPSFRMHYYAALANVSPEPRGSFKYNITEKFRVKGAGGMYSQNLIAANSDRDVVNLFYGFLTGPENLQEEYSPKPGAEKQALKSKLQKSTHAVFGFELDLLKGLDFSAEAYQKWFTQLANVNRDKIYEDNATFTTFPDFLKKDFIIETGKAYGIDFMLKYEKNRFYLWAVYSLGYNKRWDGIREYYPVWDRRHNVNLVTSYTMGKKKNWEVNARWNLGSGFPLTPTQGFYPELNFNYNVTTNYTTQNGSLGYIPGELNTNRLPYYHRLDINLKYHYDWTDRTRIEISAGATNVYNRANLFYFDRVKYVRKNQLPLLPSVNLSFTF